MKSSIVVSSLRILKNAKAAVSTAGINILVVASTIAEKRAPTTIMAKSLRLRIDILFVHSFSLILDIKKYSSDDEYEVKIFVEMWLYIEYNIGRNCA